MATSSAEHGDGAAVTLLIPASATLKDGATVNVTTTYPFEDTVVVTCQTSKSKPRSFPLSIRVPVWATNATLNGLAVAAGMFSQQRCQSNSAANRFVLELSPEIAVEEWAGDQHGGAAKNNAYSVVRGPLLYSLPLAHNFTVYGRHFGTGDQASNDYYLNRNSAWNFALVIDRNHPTKTLQFVRGAAYDDGAAPFNRSGPLSITASARLVPGWTEALNSAAPPPLSPACQAAAADCGPVTQVTLVPHGYTELRVGEFPLA